MVKDQEFLKSKASYCLDLAKKMGATDASVTVGNSISESVNFRNKTLRDMGLSEQEITEWKEMKDQVPNLQMMDGRSNKVKSYSSIQSISNFLLECIKEKKIDKFHLLGHSMGGMIVQEMAKKKGDRISKLVCYSTGHIG